MARPPPVTTMLTKTQLRSQAPRHLPLHIVETDYVQDVFLKALSMEDDLLVFKGGTCLKKFYGLDRYSEDLDFTEIQPHGDIVSRTVDRMERTGLAVSIDEEKRGEHTYLYVLRFEGPLFVGAPQSRGSLDVEISHRGDAEQGEWRVQKSPYDDIRSVKARCMDLPGILAEKVRALIERDQPRDLYDLWYFLQQGHRLDRARIEEKLAAAGVSYRIPEVQVTAESWQNDVSPLVSSAPPLEDVKPYVLQHLPEEP